MSLILSLIPRYPSIIRRTRLAFSMISMRSAVNLSYKMMGEATEEDSTPVLFLHDLLDCKKHWNSLAKTIMTVTKKIVITVDLRNHGKSPHDSSHKYEDLADDVLHLLNKLKVTKVCVVGHSMGGRTAMLMALTAPEKVAGVVIVDISPVSTATELIVQFPKIMEAMRAVDFQNIRNKSKARREAKKKLKYLISDDVALYAILRNIKYRSGGINWCCNLDALIKQFKYIASFPYRDGKQYMGPTLFIGGQRSEFIPPDDLPQIRDLFPRAVVVYVPNTGHNVHAEDPKSFLERTIYFLKNIEHKT